MQEEGDGEEGEGEVMVREERVIVSEQEEVVGEEVVVVVGDVGLLFVTWSAGSKRTSRSTLSMEVGRSRYVALGERMTVDTGNRSPDMVMRCCWYG